MNTMKKLRELIRSDILEGDDRAAAKDIMFNTNRLLNRSWVDGNMRKVELNIREAEEIVAAYS